MERREVAGGGGWRMVLEAGLNEFRVCEAPD